MNQRGINLIFIDNTIILYGFVFYVLFGKRRGKARANSWLRGKKSKGNIDSPDQTRFSRAVFTNKDIHGWVKRGFEFGKASEIIEF
jgi:hypothetical protein